MQESFECRACFHVGPLTVHGACERCGSQSVISQERLSLCTSQAKANPLATTSTSRW